MSDEEEYNDNEYDDATEEPYVNLLMSRLSLLTQNCRPKKAKRARAKKDPNKPKGAKSAYLVGLL